MRRKNINMKQKDKRKHYKQSNFVPKGKFKKYKNGCTIISSEEARKIEKEEGWIINSKDEIWGHDGND